MTVVSSSLEISWSLLFISSAGGMSILLMSTLIMFKIMMRMRMMMMMLITIYRMSILLMSTLIMIMTKIITIMKMLGAQVDLG